MRFFSAVRRRLLAENRLTRYLAYAVGEVVLVTIGILIAVQVNDWNRQREQAGRELSSLAEIRAALARDVANCIAVLEHNETKLEVVGDALLWVAGPEEMVDGERINRVMGTLASYELFTADRVAFDNLLAVDSLGLIRDRELRLTLARYYVATEREAVGTPERVKSLARRIADEASALTRRTDAATYALGLEHSLVAEPAPGSSLDRNPVIVGILTNMVFATMGQSDELRALQAQAEAAIAEIDAYLAASA